MTFSNDRLARRLRRDYHLVWENLDGDRAAGASFAHGPKDAPGSCPTGAGEHNVQILVLDEWGRLLHATAGFIDADGLAAELDLAEDLHRLIAGRKGDLARRIVKERHEVEERRDAENEAGEDEIFASFARQRRIRDHRYCARHPLQRHRDFSTAGMVGRGQSFFGSSRGGVPKERIGALPEADSLDPAIRKMLESRSKRRGGAKRGEADERTTPRTTPPRPSSRPSSRPTSII